MRRFRPEFHERWEWRFFAAWSVMVAGLIALWIRSAWTFDRLQYTSQQLQVADERSLNVSLDFGYGGIRFNCDSNWSRHIQAFQAAIKRSRTESTPTREWRWLSFAMSDNPLIEVIALGRGNSQDSGFVWNSQSSGSVAGGHNRESFVVGVPYWAIILATFIPGAVLVIHQINRRAIVQQRRMRGQCLVCGYDMRATPECCPECGTPGIEIPP